MTADQPSTQPNVVPGISGATFIATGWYGMWCSGPFEPDGTTEDREGGR